jgi:DNA mismatch repair protein MutL
MPKVMVLPEHIASQIAAGEVVERPASVVKELVENSIDAGASKIVVSVAEGCRSIRVSDNGCGMDADDAVLAFQRHATSKLVSANDLWELSTLGFRGEALPSIAAVSHVTCYSRTPNSSAGTRVDCADGSLQAVETGCAIGTVIEVSDLFYNVPARMNFMKRASTEFGHIHEIVQCLAVAYPAISFELLHEDDSKLLTGGSGNFTQAIVEAGLFFQREAVIDIDISEPDLALAMNARICRASHFRADRKGILSIVNCRPVRCPITYKALEFAYADLIPRGRYPLAVVHLTVNPKELDVNIHPTKKEIKYEKGNEVYSFVQRHLSRALRAPVLSVVGTGKPPAPSYRVEYPASTLSICEPPVVAGFRDHTTSSMEMAPLPQQKSFLSGLLYQPSPQMPKTSTIRKADETLATQSILGVPSDWRLAGYLHHSYILVETRSGLMIVEQHIAHERVMYENLVAQGALEAGGSEEVQKLIVSCPLQLSPEQLSYVEHHQAELNQLGFEFERSNDEFACVQVPADLAHTDYSKVVQEIIQSLSESVNPIIKMEITKSIACQAAIKNGVALTDPQILKLLCDWWNAPRNDTCPHGRPIQLSFSKEKLFQLFHP